MIPFTNIFLRADKRWEFHWSLLGTPAFYRVVLNGVQIDYVYPVSGNLDIWDDDGIGTDLWDDDGIGLDLWDGDYIVVYVSNVPGYNEFPPPLEMAYENRKVLSEIFKPYMLLQWYDEICASYQIDKYDFSVSGWFQVKTLNQVGNWVNQYQTKTLPDEETAMFRVSALTKWGLKSEPERYIEFINRPPDPPNALITYTSPNIIISPSGLT